MEFKKRGIGKRAQAEHEQLFIIFEVVVFAFFMYILLSFVKDVEESRILEKNYLARDMAMMVNTLYATPQNVVWIYTENTTDYSVGIGNNLVTVQDVDALVEGTERRYWFATAGVGAELGSFDGAQNIEFVASPGYGAPSIGALETEFEKPFPDLNQK